MRASYRLQLLSSGAAWTLDSKASARITANALLAALFALRDALGLPDA
jgi:hypothetical protein